MMDAARRDHGPACADGSAWRRFGSDCAPAEALTDLIPEGEGRDTAAEWIEDCACLALDRAPVAPGAHGELAQLERRTRAGLVARLARRHARRAPGLGAATVAALVPRGECTPDGSPRGASPDDALRLDLVQELARGYVVRAVERARAAAAQGVESTPVSTPARTQASCTVSGGSSARTAWALAQIAECLHPSPAARMAAVEAGLALGAACALRSPAVALDGPEPGGGTSISERLEFLAGTARVRLDSGLVAVVERLGAADAYLRGDLVGARAALGSGSLALDRSLAVASLRCVIDVELESADGAAQPGAERALDAGDRRRAARLLAAFRVARGAQTPKRPARRRRRIRSGAPR